MKIAVYGTLRKGEINYRHFIGGVRPLGRDEIQGYRMYDLGSYPYVVEHLQGASSPEDYQPAITVEVYDLAPYFANQIAGMEQRAGYEVTVISTQFGDALLFHMDTYEHERRQRQAKEQGYRLDQIPNGDWVRHRQVILAGRSNT